jgi:lysophospholipase L1-like esterase
MQENARFLDLSHEESIRPAYFESDGFHFNVEGKAAFSKILAEKLKPVLEQK